MVFKKVADSLQNSLGSKYDVGVRLNGVNQAHLLLQRNAGGHSPPALLLNQFSRHHKLPVCWLSMPIPILPLNFRQSGKASLRQTRSKSAGVILRRSTINNEVLHKTGFSGVRRGLRRCSS